MRPQVAPVRRRVNRRTTEKVSVEIWADIEGAKLEETDVTWGSPALDRLRGQRAGREGRL